jgi:hypothetical protein
MDEVLFNLEDSEQKEASLRLFPVENGWNMVAYGGGSADVSCNSESEAEIFITGDEELVTQGAADALGLPEGDLPDECHRFGFEVNGA